MSLQDKKNRNNYHSNQFKKNKHWNDHSNQFRKINTGKLKQKRSESNLNYNHSEYKAVPRLFCLCLYLNLLNLYINWCYEDDLFITCLPYLFLFICIFQGSVLAAHICSALNPLCYAAANPLFRETFVYILCRCCRHNKSWKRTHKITFSLWLRFSNGLYFQDCVQFGVSF